VCAPDQPRPTEALSGRPFSARVRALPSGASQPGGDGAASRGGPESPGPEAGLSLAWRGSIDEPASGLPFPPAPPAAAHVRKSGDTPSTAAAAASFPPSAPPARRPAARPPAARPCGDCKGSKGREIARAPRDAAPASPALLRDSAATACAAPAPPTGCEPRAAPAPAAPPAPAARRAAPNRPGFSCCQQGKRTVGTWVGATVGREGVSVQ
jgi:hypothetical protein